MKPYHRYFPFSFPEAVVYVLLAPLVFILVLPVLVIDFIGKGKGEK